MFLVSDLRTKFAVARDRTKPRLTRAFALAEVFCEPVSLFTILGAVVLAVLRGTGVWEPPPAVAKCIVPVLVSAAVGYGTNYIAITMLFEPYDKTWKHWLPWVTLGFWRQGLLPRNKGRVAAELADQVETKLLQPEKLADDLCAMVGGALQDPATLRAVQTLLQEQVAAHDAEIVDFLVPRIESALVREIDRLVTPARIKSFWDAEIMPRLESEETREEIAKLALRAIRQRAPDIAAKARPAISRAVRRWVKEKFDGSLLEGIPLVGKTVSDSLASFFASSADSLADWFLDEKTIEDGIRDWIKRPETAAALRDELAGFVESFRAWLASPEGVVRVGGFAGDIRARFKDYLRAYLRENLAPAASRLLKSEATWEWVAKAIPAVRHGVESMIRDIGTTAIVEKLDVEGRVKTAVDGMDMAEFHGMLSKIMSEHLGAIQVLGYLLGALAGLLLVFS